MIKELLEESKKNLDHFFQNINPSEVDSLVNLCFSCKGLIVCTGVGKSGIIAEKIATTLASTGTKALYLPTLNFLHGDIGILSEGDIVIMLSKSGESEELVNLIPFIRRKKAKIIGVTSSTSSRLFRQSDSQIFLPMEKELCQFDLVPTTSTQLQLLFGDVLAVALMKLRNFNLQEYALNHPSGTIGKKMTLTVQDLMIKGSNLPVCRRKDKLSDVLLELTRKKCGTLLVLGENEELEGIFTDGDLRRALQQHGTEVLRQEIDTLMTHSAISVESESLAWDAMQHMQKDANKWVMVTPVVKNNRVVGLLRMHDIIQAGLS